MTIPSLTRHWCLRIALTLGASCAFAAHANNDDEAAGASLIVQLRSDAGAGTARGARGAAGDTADTRRNRLARVLSANQLPFRTGRSVLGDWQMVDAGRALTLRDARAHAARLRADPNVAAVAINRREHRLLTPNDPLFASADPAQAQWWLQAVASGNAGVPGLPLAWDRSTGATAAGVAPARVAVLDSGITSHGELNAKLLPGYDFVQDADYANDGDGRDNDPSDPGDALPASLQAAQPALYSGCPPSAFSSWHGTLIAGQVAAVSNNGAGVAGINWAAQVVPVRVAGRCGAAVADIIDGMRWAAGLTVAGVPDNLNPARIITLSYGGEDACDANSADPDVADTAKLYLQAINEVRQQGALVFAAAGNENQGVGRPASCSGVFAVASLNRQGFKSKYSNFGAAIALATVGGDDNTGQTCDSQVADTGIVSTSNLGDVNPGAAGYAAGSGTSFAAPVAAGVASLMLAVQPALTIGQIEDGIKRSARPHALVPALGNCSASNANRCACTTATCGAGALDAEQALLFAAAPASYLPPVRSPTSVDNAGIQDCAVLLGRSAPQQPPTTPQPGASTPAASSSGGGGSLNLAWLAGLIWMVGLLLAQRVLADPDDPNG